MTAGRSVEVAGRRRTRRCSGQPSYGTRRWRAALLRSAAPELGTSVSPDSRQAVFVMRDPSDNDWGVTLLPTPKAPWLTKLLTSLSVTVGDQPIQR